MRDVVLAARLLRRSPIFTAAAVLTFALGIAVNTAVFSVINALMLRPLPVRDSDRLVVVATRRLDTTTLRPVSYQDLQDYRTGSRSVFEDIAGYSAGFVGLSADGRRPERVLVTWVTGNYFSMLDLRPALGRLIHDNEGGPRRSDSVVVLGYDTWQRRFGGDAGVLGSLVRVDGHPCTIVGIAPRGFLGTLAFSDAELYLPINWASARLLDDRRTRDLHAIARLQPGIDVAGAQAALDLVAARLARENPADTRVGVRVVPERLARPEEDQARSNARGAAAMLLFAALITLIAAVNVTNLLLARGESRRREFAVRAALGAGRGRLVRQALAENLLLAAIGGVAGVLLAAWGAAALAAVRPPGDLPVRFDFDFDGGVFAYAACIVLAAAAIASILPAVRASSGDPEATLRSQKAGAGSPRRFLAESLLTTQIAACSVMLIAAGLFARSLLAAEHADLGFQPDQVLNAHLDVSLLGYSEAQGRTFFDDVERRVRQVPGVDDVSYAFTVPMGYVRATALVDPETSATRLDTPLAAGQNIVSPAYFRVMGMPLVRGRAFTEADDSSSRPVAVVNARLAAMLWLGRNPIGQRFRAAPNGAWIEIVGVATTSKYRFLFEDPQPYFYVPIAQEYTAARVLQIRTSSAPNALAPAIEQVIRSREPDLPIYDVQSMDVALDSGPGLFLVRVGAIAGALFGVLALVLALVGLYGVVSYLTSRRTVEIGVRLAIGASPRDIVWLVLRHAVSVVSAGLAGGLTIAFAASRVFGGLLYNVSSRDSVTYTLVASLVAITTIAACLMPAMRASRLDPTAALRAE
jgi:predicted permease